MCSSHGDCAATAGFPHSEIHGSMSAFDYPWHIADRCVLRRLLVPRHSPCTLCSLTCDLSFFTRRKFVDLPFWFFFYLPLVLLHFLLCSVFKVHWRVKPLMVGSSSSHTLPFGLCVSLTFATEPFGSWWAQVDSNHRPRAYQARALTN